MNNRLPDQLQASIQKLLATHSRQTLSNESSQLSTRYRSNDKSTDHPFMTEEAHHLAYLAVRMPATYAVVLHILEQLRSMCPEMQVQSLCDLGAGPGTASWAAAQLFPLLATVELYERDPALIQIGKELMREAPFPCLRSANWLCKDLSQPILLAPCDLLIVSYLIGELEDAALEPLLASAWQAVDQALVLVEPGTPAGFERIRQAREWLIRWGATILAPCPHQNRCPMPHNDWCHFAQRLERSSLHKAVKGVSLGYEDEKYAYIVAAKTPQRASPNAMRVLRHPIKHSGHIDLTLCTKQGIEKIKYSRRDDEVYKKARKLEWGDKFSMPSLQD